MPPNTVKVSRPTQWGNPFKAGAWIYTKMVMRRGMAEPWFPRPDQPPGERIIVRDNAHAVELFRAGQIKCPWYNIESLRGKNLACWCKPGEPCHADVLLELANA